VAGINAQKQPMKLRIDLPMFAEKKATLYNENKNRETFVKEIVIARNGIAEIKIQPGGGFVIK
jgi:Na+-transporting NADH:ubiquinone oxidoreductase subunit NqrF